MRKVLMLFACSFLTIMLLATMNSYAISNVDFVGVWLFDEGSGESVRDETGNADTGNVINANWVDGKFGKALSFEGVGDSYVAVPHNDSMNQETFTVAAWINVPAPASWQAILSKDAMDIGATEMRTYGMFVADSKKTIHYSFKSENETHNTLDGEGDAADGTWHHVAMTYDGTTLRGYIDATLDAEQDFAGPPIAHDGAFNVGGQINGRYDMKGSVDEVCILKTALDENDIKDLMKGLSGVMSVEPLSKLTTTWAGLKSK